MFSGAKPQNAWNGPLGRCHLNPGPQHPPPPATPLLWTLGQNCLSWEGMKEEIRPREPWIGPGSQPSSPGVLTILSLPPTPQLAQKYDHQREQELREWIEGVTGRRIGNNFMDGLKDGIILCE